MPSPWMERGEEMLGFLHAALLTLENGRFPAMTMYRGLTRSCLQIVANECHTLFLRHHRRLGTSLVTNFDDDFLCIKNIFNRTVLMVIFINWGRCHSNR